MSESRPEIGEHFGPYLLKRLLGSGGMGNVYEAQDTAMDRTVALKLISGPYAQDPAYRQRLQREARLAGRLQDPHVVPVHSTGEIDGQLYVDMRLINGTDLDTLLERSGPLPPSRAVAIVRQIASALDAAHSVGVLHRDVKPGNILITTDDFAYLVDFGIANAATEAKVTQMGDVLGTWTYMAPERFRGDGSQVTASADTYALACVLVEALTGKPPFSGDTATLVGAHLSEPPPRVSAGLGLPPALDEVIARGLAKNPEARYATSGEFSRAAEEALSALGSSTAAFTVPAAPAPTTPLHTPPPQTAPALTVPQMPAQHWGQPQQQTPPPPTGPPGGGAPPAPAKGRRNWILLGAAVAVVVALVAGLAIWQLTKGDSSKENAVDIGTLDVGRYGIKPRPLPGPTTIDEGRALEAFRIAEGIANPYAVDPILDHLYGDVTPTPAQAAATISGTGDPLTQPVFEKYHMITGYVVEGVSKRISDFARDKEGDLLMIMATSFPNDDAAARAATEIDATDFAVNPENRVIAIPGYKQAMAHYRPGSPSIGTTIASGTFVMSVVVRSDAHPDNDYLTRRVQKTLDLQMPLIGRVIPTNGVALTGLPLDPDRMLSRTFVAGDQPKVSGTFLSMGPLAAVLCADSQAVKDGLFEQAGVDRCSMSPDAVVLRTKDEETAKAYLPKMVEAEREEYIGHDLPSPASLPDARCYEIKSSLAAESANSRFQCYVSFGRYIAMVRSNEEKDSKQRAAAQYAILVNSA